MTPSIQSLFPNASKDCIAANASDAVQPILDAPRPIPEPRRGKINKTESEFAMILEAQKRAGEILRYEFEGITLRFAGVRYTPDFVVVKQGWGLSGVVFIEIKGPFIKGNRERAVERYRHAKTYWPEFSFEMWQRSKTGEWRQIL